MFLQGFDKPLAEPVAMMWRRSRNGDSPASPTPAKPPGFFTMIFHDTHFASPTPSKAARGCRGTEE